MTPQVQNDYPEPCSRYIKTNALQSFYKTLNYYYVASAIIAPHWMSALEKEYLRTSL